MAIKILVLHYGQRSEAGEAGETVKAAFQDIMCDVKVASATDECLAIARAWKPSIMVLSNADEEQTAKIRQWLETDNDPAVRHISVIDDLGVVLEPGQPMPRVVGGAVHAQH